MKNVLPDHVSQIKPEQLAVQNSFRSNIGEAGALSHDAAKMRERGEALIREADKMDIEARRLLGEERSC